MWSLHGPVGSVGCKQAQRQWRSCCRPVGSRILHMQARIHAVQADVQYRPRRCRQAPIRLSYGGIDSRDKSAPARRVHQMVSDSAPCLRGDVSILFNHVWCPTSGADHPRMTSITENAPFFPEKQDVHRRWVVIGGRDTLLMRHNSIGLNILSALWAISVLISTSSPPWNVAGPPKEKITSFEQESKRAGAYKLGSLHTVMDRRCWTYRFRWALDG